MLALDALSTALNRLQSSVRNFPALYSFVGAVAAQVQELDAALLAADARTRGLIPADSDGPSWLAQIASLLGTTRGSDETDARAIQYLQAQAVTITSFGRLGDIQFIADTLYGATNTSWISDGGSEPSAPPSGSGTWGTGVYVRVEPLAPATPVTLPDYLRCRAQLQRAKPAGVLLAVGGTVGSVGTTLFKFDGTGPVGFDSVAVFYTFA